MLVEGLFFLTIPKGMQSIMVESIWVARYISHIGRRKKIERASYEPLKPITSTVHPLAMPHH